MIRPNLRLLARLLKAAIPAVLAFGVLMFLGMSTHRSKAGGSDADALSRPSVPLAGSFDAATVSQASGPQTTSFKLLPAGGANGPIAQCLAHASAAAGRSGGLPASVNATVIRGQQNDTMSLTLFNFPPNIDFDLFTVENNTSPFGLAWYQSDVNVNSGGTAQVQIQTILLDQIFGFDGTAPSPTNTFNVGFWFNDPQQAFDLGCEPGAQSPVVTPFNGDHNAGPLAFITSTVPSSGLGPLCTQPEPGPICNP